MASSIKFLLCLGPHGFHRMAYRQFGAPDCKRHLVCVHGLTRNSTDFERFAEAMQDEYLVTCPDVVGRGHSDWLPVKTDYGYPLYLGDAATLLGRLDARSVDWIGTSMGGLIGMHLAAKPGSPIRKLVLNDIGPFVPAAFIERVQEYIGLPMVFTSAHEAEEYLRELYQGFGPLTDDQWREVTLNSTTRQADGSYVLAYDPGIAEPFKAAPTGDSALWEVWEKVDCPVLVLRGAESEALRADTLKEMKERKPDIEVIEIPKTGHVPPLMDPVQISKVRNWLLKD